MNQTAYYNIFLYFFLVVFLLNPLSGRLIKPSENGEEKEILVVNSKRRLYYPIKSEGLIFKIFQTPEADVIIFLLHLNSQNKKIRVFVFLRILT